jgi:3-oxoacyl-[acyl-carrier protein] reductase
LNILHLRKASSLLNVTSITKLKPKDSGEKMQLNLKGKVAMVAASSKGLGFGIAQELAREGAKLSIGSRSKDGIESAAKKLREETQADVLSSILDASNNQSIEDWTKRTTDHFGGVDLLVVNAGGPPPGKFMDFTDENWQAAFDMNLMSAVRMIRQVIPSMESRGGGSILTVTSSSVKEPIDVLILSNVMRSGVTSLVKSLSLQLAPKNIRVNNLMPGRIDTDRVRSIDENQAKAAGISVEERKAQSRAAIPLQRYGTIEDFGKMGAFLLSEAASYVTGSSIAVDGGSIKTVW